MMGKKDRGKDKEKETPMYIKLAYVILYYIM